MTMRKPKLNLLYATDTSTPWLQLAVVQTEPNPTLEHARQWQSARYLGAAPREPAIPHPLKH
jgi:hypothetical protein